MNLIRVRVALLAAVISLCTVPAQGRRHFSSNRPTWETAGVRTAAPDRRSRNREIGTRYEAIPKRSERRRLDWGRNTISPLGDAAFATMLSQVESSRDGKVSIIGHQGMDRAPLYRLDLPAVQTGKVRPRLNKDLKRPLRVLISAKIHGDEHVGSYVVQQLVQRLMKDKNLRASFDLTILPELNVLDRRLAPGMVNLNRTFPPRATRATNLDVMHSTEGERYDLFVGLHSALKDGFFLIRNGEDHGMSRRILGAMNSAVLLDAPAGETKVGAYQLHCLGGAQSNNPGTFKGYMDQQGVPYSYTLEASRMLTPEQQVRGATKLVLSAMNNVVRHGKFSDGN